MANFDKPGNTKFDKMAESPAAPAGMKQAATRFDRAQTAFQQGETQQQPWLPQSMMSVATQWYSGQNAQGMGNGWDTDFYRSFMGQLDSWTQASVDAKRGSLFYEQFDPDKNPTATGVALWDSTKVDPATNQPYFRFGDVILNGKVQPGQNLYEVFDKETADKMLGQFILSPQENARLFKEKSPENYSAAVDRVRKEWNDKALYAKSAEQYQTDMRMHEDSIVRGKGDDAIVGGGLVGGIVTGAGAGAVLTAVTGPGALIGGIVGGIAGGVTGLVGSWLNKDELTDIAARAATKQDYVKRDYTGFEELAAQGFPVSDWGALGQKLISPGSNVVRGVVEVQNGGRDDQQVDWNKVDAEGKSIVPGWARAADLTATVADSVVQFSSPVGRMAYMGTMGTTVTGKSLALMTDEGFNEARGQFDEYDGKERMAAFGSVGIDAAQMFTGGMLGKIARNTRARAGFAELPGRGVGEAETIAGNVFTRDAAGTIASRRLSATAWVPSEAAQALPVAMKARAAARVRGTAVTPDDYYNAATELVQSSVYRTALINGYAESLEEGVQALLDPVSLSEQIVPRQVLESMAYGAASGLGMGGGLMNQPASRDAQNEAMARATWQGREGVVLTDEEWSSLWKGMDPRAREMLMVRTPEEDEQFAVVRAATEDALTMETVRNSAVATAGVTLAREDATTQAASRANKLGGDQLILHAATADMLRVGGLNEKMRFNPDTAAMSLDQFVQTLIKNASAVSTKLRTYSVQSDQLAEVIAELTTQINAATDQAEIDRLTAQRNEFSTQQTRVDGYVQDLKETQAAVDLLIGTNSTTGELITDYETFKGTTDVTVQARLVLELNEKIDTLVDGSWAANNGVTAESARQVVEFLLPRQPHIDDGSFMVFVPKVSMALTSLNAHRSVYVHQAVLKAPAADHDGDAVTQQFDTYIPRAERDNYRRGTQFWTNPAAPAASIVEGEAVGERSWVLNMDLPDSEEAFIDMIANPMTVDHAAIVTDGLKRLRKTLMQRYADSGVLDWVEFSQALDRFEANARAGVTTARTILLQDMWGMDAAGLFAMSDTTHVPETTMCWSLITAAWESIGEARGHFNFVNEAELVEKEPPRERIKDQAELDTRAQLQAATQAQTMGMLGGYLQPRPSQFLQYQPLIQAAIDLSVSRREETMARQETNPELVLAEAYARLGSDKTETDREAIENYNSIENRVLDWLKAAGKEVGDISEFAMSGQQLMLLLSQTRVADFDLDLNTEEYTLVDGRDISLLQLFLRMSLKVEAQIHQGMDPDSPKAKKIRKLNGLAFPEATHSKTAAQATIEVFGDLPLSQLLGRDAYYLGPDMTLRQYMETLLGQSSEQATQTLRAIKQNAPSYYSHHGMGDAPWPIEALYRIDKVGDEYVPGAPTTNGFTMLVDALQTTVNAERANRARVSADYTEKFEKGLRDFGRQLDTWRGMFTQEIKAAYGEVSRRTTYKYLMERRPDLAEQVAQMIPAEARLAVFMQLDGQASVAKFVESVFTDPDVKRGAVNLFVLTKLAEYNVLQGSPASLDALGHFDEESGTWIVPKADDVARDMRMGAVNPLTIKSRFLETMYYLGTLNDGHHELRRFLKTALEATSIDDLYTKINKEPAWLFGRAELHPFADATSTYMQMPSDVYDTGSADVTQREAIDTFATQMARMAQARDESKDIEESNRTLLQRMKELLAEQERDVAVLTSTGMSVEQAWVRVRRDAVDKDTSIRLQQHEQALDNARMFGDGIGPNIRMQIMEALDEGLLRAHDKGKADERLAALGDLMATIDTIGYGTGLALEMNALHAYDWEDVAASPTMLTHGPVRVQLRDGSIVVIDMSSMSGALDALQNPATQAFARAAEFRINRDVTKFNTAAMYQASVHAGEERGQVSDIGLMLDEASTFGELFTTQQGDLELDRAFNLISHVESFLRRQAIENTSDDAGDSFFPITRMIANILEAYHTSDGAGRSKEQRMKMQRTLVIQVADALTSIGSVDKAVLPQVQQLLTAEMQSREWGDDSGIDELLLDFVSKKQRDVVRDLLGQRIVADFSSRADSFTQQSKTLEAAGDQQGAEEAKRLALEMMQQQADFLASGMDLGKVGPVMLQEFAAVRGMWELSHDPDQVDQDAVKKIALVAWLADGDRITKFEGVKGAIELEGFGEVAREESFHALVDTFRKKAHDPNGGVEDMSTWDNLEPNEWDQLAAWATVLYFDERAIRSSYDVKANPAILGTIDQVAKLYDTSWASLADVLFDDKVHTAMQVMLNMGSGNLGRVDARKRKTTKEAIVKQLMGTILHEERLGPWNSLIPNTRLAIETAFRQSQVGAEIPKGGNYPKLFSLFTGNRFKATFDEVPQDEHFSTADLHVAKGKGSSSVFDQITYVKLHNHFVESVDLVPDSDPSAPRSITGLCADTDESNDVTRTSGLYMLDTARLQMYADEIARTEPAYADGYTIRVRYVDVDKRPSGFSWVNNRFFDGRGRDAVMRQEQNPVSSMIFRPGGESKLQQQGPLDQLTGKGTMPTAYNVIGLDDVIRTLESYDFVTMLHRKAWHLLTRDYPLSQLSLDDLPGMYIYVKSRHIVVGRDSRTGDLTRMWAEQYIDYLNSGEQWFVHPEDPNAPAIVVPLSVSTTHRLHGGTGFDPRDPQRPTFNTAEQDRLPDLSEARLRRLGLENLGMEADLVDAPVPAFLELSKSRRARGQETSPVAIRDATIADWVKNQNAHSIKRAQQRDNKEGTFNPSRINKKGWNRVQKMLDLQKVKKVLQRHGMPVLPDAQRLAQSNRALRRLRERFGPGGVIWDFQLGLPQSQYVEGILGRVDFEEDFFTNLPSRPVFGDLVIVDLSSIYDWSGQDEETAITRAKEVVDRFAQEGVTIVLGGTSEVSGVYGAVSEYLTSGPGKIQYRRMNGGSDFFEPAISIREVDRTREALESSLAVVQATAAKNINLHLITEEDLGLNEGARMVNDEFNEVFRRISMQLIPTNFMMQVSSDTVLAYSLPDTSTEAFEKTSKTLLDWGRTAEGRAQLLEQMGDFHESIPRYELYADGKKYSPGVLDKEEALDRFLDRLEAGTQLTDAGQRVFPGDMYFLVGTNGNLLLHRIGCQLPTFPQKGYIESQWRESIDGTPHGLRIAVTQPKMSENITTLPPFTVDDARPDHRGMMLFGKFDLGWAMKMIFHGEKTTLVPMREGESFIGPMSIYEDNGVQIGSMSSRAGKESKAAMLNAVTNFRELFALTGVDFRNDLVELLLPGDPRTWAEKWDAVEQFLTNFSLMNNTLKPSEVADLLASTVKRSEFIAEVNAKGTSEFGKAWIRIPEHPGVATISDQERLGQVILLTLAIAGMKPSQVVSMPGLLTVHEASHSNAMVGWLPPVMTGALSSVQYPGLHELLIKRANGVLANYLDANGEEHSGSWFDNDFTFHTLMRRIDPDTGNEVLFDRTGILQLEEVLPADENPVTREFSFTAARNASMHIARVAAAQGYQVVNTADRELGSWDVLEGDNEILRFGGKDGAHLADLVSRVLPRPDDYYPAKYKLPMEQIHWDKGDEEVGAYTQPIQKPKTPTNEWDDLGQAVDILKILGLDPINDLIEIDYLVRQWHGMPAPRTKDEYDPMTHELYLEAVTAIWTNIQRGMHPLHGADVPLESRTLWAKIFKAQENRGADRWSPLQIVQGKRGKTKRADYNWATWVDTLMGQTRSSNDEFHAMYRVALDGFFHTFQGAAPGFENLPLSMDEQINAKLLDPKTNEPYASLDLGVHALMRDPFLLESMQATWATISGHEAVYNRDAAKDTPASSSHYRRTRRNAWIKENELGRQKKTSMADYARQGVTYRENLNNGNVWMRNLYHATIATRLLNPGLWVSAFVEVPLRSGMENVTDLLLGRNPNLTGSILASQRKGFAGKQIRKILESELGQQMGWDTIDLAYSQEEIGMLRGLAKQMGHDPKWRGLLFGETTYQNMITPMAKLDDEGQIIPGGRFSNRIERLASFAARVFNDPTLGQTQEQAAMRYLMAAVEYLTLTNNHISIPALVQSLEQDPEWLQKQFSTESFNPHLAGSHAVAQVRSTKGTWFGDLIMRPIDSLYSANSPGKALLGLGLKIPFAFTRFAVNATLTLAGLNAADQGMAMLLDSRETLGSRWRRHFSNPEEGEVSPDYYDFKDVYETFDLGRVVMRGAVTQAGLVALGLAGANILNLGGEDEEQRRRKRQQRYLSLPTWYDPRQAENDFTYADAMWLDSIPFLNTLYARDYDGQNRAAVVPHWILRQFTSPLMGVVRFFDTGDFRNIGWGFQDAVSVIPNQAINLWRDAELSAKLMISDAEALDSQGLDTVEKQSRWQWLIASAVGMYERALLENQFINGIATAFDQVDRNPYAIPAMKDGEYVKVPDVGGYQPTSQEEALQQIPTDPLIDPLTGEPMVGADGQPLGSPEVRLRYAKRTGLDALLHQYGENNVVAAGLLSLFTGQWNGDSTFLRKNMVPKQPLVPIHEAGRAEAEALIVAAWTGAGGQERFTKEEIIRALKFQSEKAGVYWHQDEIEARADAVYKQFGDKRYALSIIDKDAGEIITKDGAFGVYKSLWSGMIDLNSPALKGMSIPYDMRQEIAEEWLTELKQESINAGMSEESAMYRVRRFWYGDEQTGRPGLREILYSDKIPSIPITKYTQLNVTYTIGPDGRPWATPFTRATGFQAFGIPVPHPVAPLAEGTRLDTRGNVVNTMTQTNTGLKAVVPSTVAGTLKPDDDVLEKVEKKRTTSTWSPTGRGYFRYGGFGGYSRGGYSRGSGYSSSGYKTALFTERILRTLRAGYGPQMNGVYTPNADRPTLRRADVRRERFSSERGRLKQWQ
jgi:hypothetical protein